MHAKVMYILPDLAPSAHRWYGTDTNVDWMKVEVKALECWVLTSPNLNELPQFNIGPQPLRARDDGRFGFEDPMQAPQEFDRDLPQLACIPRPGLEDIPKCMQRVAWDGIPAFRGIDNDFSRGLGLYDQDQVEEMEDVACT